MQLELWQVRLPLIHAVCGNEWPCTGSRHGEADEVISVD
jgi:hypothetical protein